MVVSKKYGAEHLVEIFHDRCLGS